MAYEHLKHILPRPVFVAIERASAPSSKTSCYIYYPTRGMKRALKMGLIEVIDCEGTGACAYRRTKKGQQKFVEYEKARTARFRR